VKIRLGGLATAVALTAGLVGAGTTAAQAETRAEAPCSMVYQYVVDIAGDMTDAESGGNYVGNAVMGDKFNVRVKGNPRHYGANVGNGKWGWILAGKLVDTGLSWCE
jgi:hypothetical protein